MGTYSEKELEVLRRLSQSLDAELESIMYDNIDKDRMLYSVCANDIEKEEFTKKSLKRHQKKIAKCGSNISIYISAFLSDTDRLDHKSNPYVNLSFRENICSNFISNFSEAIEEVSNEFEDIESVSNEDELFFMEVLKDESYSLDVDEINDFLKYMGFAERLLVFKEILKSVEEDKKKPKLDVILDKMKAKATEVESKKISDELSATLDNLRGQHISTLQLYNIIKTKTKLEKDALEYLKNDVEWYLWRMKLAQECFYIKDEVDFAYKKIEEKYSKEKQLELGYLKKTKTFLGVEYTDPKEPIYIDKEKLLYPNEFTSIKDLLGIIDKELIKAGENETTINTSEDPIKPNIELSVMDDDKNKIVNSFKATLIEIDSITEVYNNKDTSNEKLLKRLKAAQSLLFDSYSALNIFDELVENNICAGYKIIQLREGVPKKKQLKKVEIKIIYNQLINVLKENKNHLNIIPKKKVVLKNQYDGMLYNLSSPYISDEIKKLRDVQFQNKITKVKATANLGSLLSEILSYLHQILTFNIYFIFEEPNITYTNEIKFPDYKKQYIESWVNCSVETSAIGRNSKIDYWNEIIDLKLDNEHFERIEKYQEQLFNERVESEVRITFSDIEELKVNQQKEQIEKELTLINGFFNGDLSKLTVKRLKEIIQFSKPKKLILAYDELKKNNYYLATEYLIYNIGRPRMYSNYFVAAFFIKYIEVLTDYKSTISKEVIVIPKPENIPEPQPKRKRKIKHCSFTYINNVKRQSQLTDLMNALKRKELIAGDTELAAFRKIFSGVEIEKPIVWKGNISELSYFIKQLHNILKYVENVKLEIWTVTINCFIQESGEPYNRTKLRTQKVPATSKNIDSALNTLK